MIVLYFGPGGDSVDWGGGVAREWRGGLVSPCRSVTSIEL